MNFGRKMMKAGVAAVAAIATLGAGGVVASTAFAGGGGGNQPGTGGDLAAVQFWQYKDDASGAWGPATSLDSVRAAMNNAGVTLEGDGVTKAQAALDQARTECETGFQRRHPGEGNGDCRVVAVGAVPAVIGGNYIYNGSGAASPTGTGGWYDNWNTYVAPGTYQYGSTVYRTSYPFDDDPSNSVDAIMRRNVEASSKPSIVVIVLDKYQPAPPSYHLSISTQAAEMSGQAGDTKDASDTITLSSDGSKTENVNGTATLHWRGVDGTEKTVAKQFTASNKGSATVSASFKDMDASWESWPAGKRWWDVDVAKQGGMAEAVSHKGESDAKESGEKTTTPPEKWLTNEAGDTVRDGNDSIASGSLYTAHIKAHSNASNRFWIYDTIDTRDVVIGGTEQDDVSKVTVTDANGNIVPADISIDDSIDGKRVVKAHATAPHSGLYTLNVPQSAKPTGGDYEINDGSVACWNGDNGTGSLADCQTGDSDSVGKVTPTPDKVWVLDESGALVAEDKQWTNQQGVDQKTFLVGDQVGVVVNGSIPSHLLNPLASYSITDDLTGSNQWIDWKSGKVFVDGKDETANFTIAIDRKAGTATATAKSAYIAKTMFRNSASKVRFYLTGTIKKGATEGRKIQLTNKAYEKWNNETRPTNEPPVFVWTPNPNKAWAMKVGGKWQLTVDPAKSDKVGGDDKYYRLGDEVAAVVSGTLPTGLGRVPEIAWTDDFANVDSILDLKDTSNIKVYEQDTTDEANAGVNDLNKTGRDVTDQFDITAEGTKVTVSAKDSYEAAQKDLETAKQISVVIPFDVNFDTVKLLESYGKAEGDELNTCADPKGDDLDNKGGQTVGGSTVDTNTPKICVTVPPIHKQVIAESSQGGDQSSIDTKTVFPGQTVEYTVRVDPQIPADQAYSVTAIKLSDTYSEYTTANKQTLEITDLGTGGIIPKSAYKVQWDEKAHSFEATFARDWVAANWKAGSNPRVLLRFEAKVNEDAPTDKTVGNKAALTVNNGVTPSNKVENEPPVIKPSKQDTQKDPTINIDGKTALLGDEIYYRVNIDASRLTDTAYKVWRLGMTDDYDDEYLKLDATNVEILDETGKDVTDKFNIQDKDGVLYAYAKLVDTEIPATGETVKGDPQPEDLKAYSESDEHDPLTRPAIDQTLLGHTYTVTMPMTVIKVTDGYTVKNKATQVLNKIRKDTNEVTNPLKPINPAKDVTVKVGGASANGKSIYKGRSFLYQLDSSILPANRAYPQVDKWDIVDSLDPAFDEYTGQWAVYATRDLLSGGEALASKGDRIAGSGFDSSKLGGDLFTLSAATVDGRNVVTIEATDRYRALVSDDSHEAGWRACIQCKRLAVTDRHENQFTEHYNDKTLESNVVWTRTPDMTPSIDVQKWDRKSGWPNGDRDNSKDALTVSGDTEIVFTITNTSKTDPDTKQGAVFRTKDIKLEDSTIVGDGEVVDLKYPADWDTKVLKPGESIEVTGTLKGVTKTHTDRAKVTGTPLTECPVDTSAPFGDGTSDDESGSKPEAETKSKSDDVVTIDGKDYCSDTKVESATDDWNGYRRTLAQTGAGIALIALAAVVVLGGGAALMAVSRRRKAKAPADTEGSEE
ncbi:isopeptide-forming domain-containing fimbrial protein [Bifidobacterium longum]|nr:isopeptide-forming domain-containing fimbrial protein [Bifidobacterium longum]